ncbi:MAG: Fe-S cluster assembly protein SufB, partial [Candidatus Parvarchaeota archaeon]|nr:Fe-S cluster assembly protein SufB [Candidatus Parvarchaeota archaeon]
PLQTYFRMNKKSGAQFEHTLIIADKESEVTYVEGCSSPIFEPDNKALHAAVVEVFVEENARVKFISAENWSRNVYNLNTKRAIVGKNAHMEWVEATLGSKVTMLYPASYLRGEGASSSSLTISFAQPGTWKDSGSKVIMSAPNQTAKIISKSISLGGGNSVYRGLLRINRNADRAKAYTQCDSLLLDENASTSTFPHNEVLNSGAKVYHEATVGKISKEKLFYLMSRGVTEAQARSLIVLGFLDTVLKEIPLEFAVEINRLIETEISTLPGATG